MAKFRISYTGSDEPLEVDADGYTTNDQWVTFTRFENGEMKQVRLVKASAVSEIELVE